MVFARAPRPGRCKTRLAPRYGARGAARLHRLLTVKTLQTALASDLPVELWCAPDARHGFFHACRRHYGLRLRRQPAGDLGRKMSFALSTALASGANQALVIGTDCAALETRHLHEASAELGRRDCVLQPAGDGGYVLIGARVPIHAVLRDIRWSSGRELTQTRQRLERRALSCGLLRPLWDVDHPRDVQRARRLRLL